MERTICVNDTSHIFKLTDLISMCEECLVTNKINKYVQSLYYLFARIHSRAV